MKKIEKLQNCDPNNIRNKINEIIDVINKPVTTTNEHPQKKIVIRFLKEENPEYIKWLKETLIKEYGLFSGTIITVEDDSIV